MALTAQQFLQATYVAYWGRAADPQGFNHWLGEFNDGTLDFAGIADNFALSDEATDNFTYFNAAKNFPNLIDDNMRENFVKEIYNNLFERAPEADALTYWVDQLKTAEGGATPGSFIADIVYTAYQQREGDSSDDWTSVSNKVEVAQAITAEAIDANLTNDEAVEFVRSQAATDLIDETTKDSTVADQVDKVDNLDAGTTTGQTFTLTDATDVITGTSGDDKIIAAEDAGTDALQAGDSIDGAGGTDTMNVFGDDNINTFAMADISNVEKVFAQFDASPAADDLDVSGNADVNEAWVSKGKLNGNDEVTLVKDQTAGISGTVDVTAATDTLTFEFDDATAATGDEASLAMSSGNTTAANNVDLCNWNLSTFSVTP
ncbi:MAG: DUF4214 domain-containing protein [Desulfohalobiaceae bacterium]|nr:DUF4214 domain-containing protein [Desulfohalobiaceae bacterium]